MIALREDGNLAMFSIFKLAPSLFVGKNNRTTYTPDFLKIGQERTVFIVKRV